MIEDWAYMISALGHDEDLQARGISALAVVHDAAGPGRVTHLDRRIV